MKTMFSMVFLIGIAALVGLAVMPRTGQAQGNRVLVAEGDSLGHKLGHDVALTGASVVTLGPPDGVLPLTTGNRIVGRLFFSLDGTASAQRYFITDLGTLGGTHSFAYAINDLGQVVGECSISGDVASHACLFNNGKMSDLYPLNSQGVQTLGPTSINNAGQIASGAILSDVYVPAILNGITGRSRRGSCRPPQVCEAGGLFLKFIGSLGGVTSFGFNGVATSINNVGSVVGYSYIDGVTRHAFLYRNGVMSDIGASDGYSAALSINDAEVIVGFASDMFNGVAHAFVSVNNTVTNIHPATESYARDINNKGEVVGEFLTPDQTAFHAFFYSHGNFIDLGLAGAPETNAYAINDLSQIVGITSTPNGQHAFLYDEGVPGRPDAVVPKGRGWELTWAFDINNQSQIVGYGLLNGQFRSFLLTPAISTDQCKDGGWGRFGFKNEGQCIQFVNTGS